MRTSTFVNGPIERSGLIRVLLLDDSVEDARRVRDLLEPEDSFRLQCARSAEEAERALLGGMFDVALIEESLWHPGAADVGRFVRENHIDTAIVLLVTGEQAQARGAHDIINKAALGDADQFAQQIVAAFDRGRTLRRRETMVRWLEREARTDRLTGLLNRRAFDEHLDAACRTASSNGEPIAIVLVNVAGTRQVNDAYGQSAEEGMIRRTARAIASCVRGGDIAARTGDDDFGIIAAGGDIDLGRRMARRIAHQIERSNSEYLDGEIPVKVSFGVASGFACHPGELFAAADQQLSTQKSVHPAVTPFCPRNDQDGPSVA